MAKYIHEENQFLYLGIDHTLEDILPPDQDLSRVEELTLPARYHYHVGWRMYEKFENLRTIRVPADHPVYESMGGCLYRKLDHTLLYVPPAKRTLHLPANAVALGYRCLHPYRVESVTVDPRNPHFANVYGMLTDRKIRTLYYIPPDRDTLTILREVEELSDHLFLRDYANVAVEPGNRIFNTANGTLFRQADPVYLCPSTRSVYLSASAWSLSALRRAPNLCSVAVDPAHPRFAAADGVLYNKERTRVELVPLGCDRLHLPDSAEDPRAEWFHPYLKEISLPARLRLPCKIFPKGCAVTLRRPDGFSFTVQNSAHLNLCANYLRNGRAEVKAGAEGLFADLLMRDPTPSPQLLSACRRSAGAILTYLIQNDMADQLRTLHPYLISPRNRKRTLRLARSLGKDHLCSLI